MHRLKRTDFDLVVVEESEQLLRSLAGLSGKHHPNITHAMNRLESQLNCVLFIRSNRGVTLTPEGEMLYTRISSAAVQIQDAEEELSASAFITSVRTILKPVSMSVKIPDVKRLPTKVSSRLPA